MVAVSAMRACCLILLAPLIAGAQFPPSELTGIVLERDANVVAGEFSVRALDNQVYRYHFDDRTTVARDTFSGPASWIKPGDKVSVQSTPVENSLLRYARVVQVLSSAPAAYSENRARLLTSPLADLTPHTGNLTFAGVVAKCNDASMVLRTRSGDQTLLIRHDTRYVANGDTVEATKLQPNMRVFVRAGKNLYEQVEAYQVIWGSILEPVRK
jgi:hypothetical protein